MKYLKFDAIQKTLIRGNQKESAYCSTLRKTPAKVKHNKYMFDFRIM